MRKIALALVSLAVSFPAWAGVQDFSLVNNTGEEVTELYVSPTETNDWEEDVLGVDVLSDKESVTVQFSPHADNCIYDLKLVHSDGASAVWDRINLCQVSTIDVSYDRNGTPQAELD